MLSDHHVVVARPTSAPPNIGRITGVSPRSESFSPTYDGLLFPSAVYTVLRRLETGERYVSEEVGTDLRQASATDLYAARQHVRVHGDMSGIAEIVGPAQLFPPGMEGQVWSVRFADGSVHDFGRVGIFPAV
ncbi:MAG TPA: hypothetical protein VKS25_09170 [Solirubrobacteraceae bacterium]|nr:hypothetical protein [Solirubrobacteraceae bacterium]